MVRVLSWFVHGLPSCEGVTVFLNRATFDILYLLEVCVCVSYVCLYSVPVNVKWGKKKLDNVMSETPVVFKHVEEKQGKWGHVPHPHHSCRSHIQHAVSRLCESSAEETHFYRFVSRRNTKLSVTALLVDMCVCGTCTSSEWVAFSSLPMCWTKKLRNVSYCCKL